MENVIKSPFKKRKKISLNISADILNLVKELARLTKTNNTQIIECLLLNGFSPLIRQFKTSWVTLLGATKEESTKELIKKTLEELKKISEKEEYRSLVNS